MSPGVIQVLTLIGGATITAAAGYWTALQQRRQTQLTTLLDALQQDNKDLREENRKLREEAAEKRNTRHEPRQQRPKADSSH